MLPKTHKKEGQNSPTLPNSEWIRSVDSNIKKSVKRTIALLAEQSQVNGLKARSLKAAESHDYRGQGRI